MWALPALITIDIRSYTNKIHQDFDGTCKKVDTFDYFLHFKNNKSLIFSYPQLVGVRVCLGVAEAGLFPGVVY